MLIAIGMAVGALTMQTLDGHDIAMSNYGSRNGTAIVFFSSRCPVTQQQIGRLLQVHNKHKREEVLYIGLCANDAETANEIRNFCQRNEVNFPVYRDRGGAIAKMFGAEYTPQAFLLDAKGVLIHKGGFQNDGASDDMDVAITQLLSGKPVSPEFSAPKGTPISSPGNPVPAGDPMESIRFSSELVFDKLAWTPDHHCSTLAEAPNGDLVCVWFGGSFECADDQALFIARKCRNSAIWSAPDVLTRGEFLKPPGNAVIFRSSPTRLMVFYDRMEEERPIRNGRWRKGRMMRMTSDDSGKTWSKEVDAGLSVGGLRNAPITLKSSAIALPISNPPGFLISSDQGATWTPSGAMNAGGQPAIVERRDGSLLSFLRNKPSILVSESRDDGVTWTPTRPSSLPNPGAGLAMRKLRSGNLILVYNPTTELRSPLSVALSRDHGATWSPPVHLESNPGEYSYPCVIETADGAIHVSYSFLRRSIKHAEFNERWVNLLTPQ